MTENIGQVQAQSAQQVHSFLYEGASRALFFRSAWRKNVKGKL